MGNICFKACGPDSVGTEVSGNSAIDFNGNRKSLYSKQL